MELDAGASQPRWPREEPEVALAWIVAGIPAVSQETHSRISSWFPNEKATHRWGKSVVLIKTILGIVEYDHTKSVTR
jgi:hypothetical protein